MNETTFEITNLNDQAYTLIKNKIVNGEIEPGTRMIDSKLAEAYGISRTPVRDALRKLTEDGFLEKRSARGYYVYELTQKDIDEIFEIRKMFDCEACRKIINVILPKNPNALDSVYGAMKEIYENDTIHYENHITDDEKFHVELIKIAGNERLLKYYIDLQEHIKIFRGYFPKEESALRIVKKQHTQLVEALKNRDIEAAMNAVEEHTEFSRKMAVVDYL